MDDLSDLIDAAFEKADDLMNSVYVHTSYDLKANEEKEHTKVLDGLSRLEESLKESLRGLENLRSTYGEDKTTVLQLTLFSTKIKKKTQEILKFRTRRARQIDDETE